MEGTGDSVEEASQEAEAVAGERVLIDFQTAPDFDEVGEVGVVGVKGFDDEATVVMDVFQGRGDAAPVDVARARRAAVVLRGVHVREARAGQTNRGAEVFLLDVHLKCVEEDSELGVIDLVDQAAGVGGRIQESGVEAGERLDRDAYF